jgi:mono/diheme cytochrome c family protein
MQRKLPHLLAMGTSIGLIAAALAQDLPGNIASGRHIAESWCTRCHQINLDELVPLAYPPNFVEIANSRLQLRWRSMCSFARVMT